MKEMRGTTLSSLFPPFVSTAVMRDLEVGGQIYPTEEVLIRSVSEKRRKEFIAGRVCAREAMRHLGVAVGPIGRLPSGAPRWPELVTGSISHTDGFAVAAVCRTGRATSIGIDVENVSSMSEEIWPLLFTSGELERILNNRDKNLMATIMFSAKESFYKGQSIITGEWLDFLDVEISVSKECFEIEVLRSDAGSAGMKAAGKVVRQEDFVITGVLFT